MDDRAFADLMVGAGFENPLGDLWEIALLDTDPEPHDIDPAMEARCEASIAATGDGLTGSLWGETADAEDRQGTWWTPTASDPGKHEDWDDWLDDWHKEDDK